MMFENSRPQYVKSDLAVISALIIQLLHYIKVCNNLHLMLLELGYNVQCCSFLHFIVIYIRSKL